MGLKVYPFLDPNLRTLHTTWKVVLYKTVQLRSDSDPSYAQYCMDILPINYVVDPRKL